MSTKSRIPSKIRNHVFASFDSCAACGTWDADECGHIVAEAMGGAMIPENFVRLCGACNRLQGTATVAFATFASYTLEPALVKSRRAHWAKYCRAAQSNMKIRAYRPAN